MQDTEELAKIVSEKEINGEQYEITLLDFDKAFELIKNRVRPNNYIPTDSVLFMGISPDTTIILPVPQTRQKFWFVVSNNGNQISQGLKVVPTPIESLKNVVGSCKKVTILINESFTKLLQ